MATEPGFSFDLLDFGDDEHFPCFLTVRHDDEEVLLVSSDVDLAARIQFQEVLMDSLINLDMSSTVSSSSSSSSVMTNGIPFPEYFSDQPSLYVKAGEPYESSCGICLEKKKDYQLVRNESCAQSICLACSKTIELSKEELYSEELLNRPSSENYSAKLLTGSSTSNPKTQRDFEGQHLNDRMNDPLVARMGKEEDSLNAMKEREQNREEDGHECTKQSRKDPSSAQDKKEDTAQPMKKKGKEKESC